jgi:hypothetical protein
VGETAKTVKVTLLNDTASESSEAFNLVLSSLNAGDDVSTRWARRSLPRTTRRRYPIPTCLVDDIVVGRARSMPTSWYAWTEPNTATVKVNYGTYAGSARGYSYYDYVTTVWRT